MTTIYISSTFSDLKEYRRLASDALRQIGHTVFAMEDYLASDQRPLQRCLLDIERCNLYVGIFAWSYGYIPTEDNPDAKSITELEFRHARSRALPCLLFLVDEAAPWPHNLQERGEGEAKLLELRRELASDHLVSFFREPENLARLVAESVTSWEKRLDEERGSASLVATDQEAELQRQFDRLAGTPEEHARARRALAIFLFERQVVYSGVAGQMYKRRIDDNTEYFASVSEPYADEHGRKVRRMRTVPVTDGVSGPGRSTIWRFEEGEWSNSPPDRS